MTARTTQGAAPIPARQNEEPFAFAWLWERWDEELETCALITTTANEVVAMAHDRMPVILRPEDYQAWLDPQAENEELLNLLKPYPAKWMEGYAVGLMVNKPSYDGPECVEGV